MKPIYKIGAGAMFLFMLAVIIFLLIDGCNAKRHNNNLLGKLQLEKQVFSTQRAKDSSEIVKQQQLVLSEREAKELGLIQLSKEIASLKKVTAQIKSTTEFIYDKLDIPFDSSKNTPVIIQVDSSDYLKLPQAFKDSSKWFNTEAFVDKKGLHFDKLQFKNEAILTIGLEYKGLLSKPNPQVVLQNMNPHATTTQFSNVIVQNKKKWYQTNGFWWAFGLFKGLIGGILIGTQFK